MSVIAVLVTLLGVFFASLLVERLLGRSRKELVKPGWYYAFFATLIPLVALVYNTVGVESVFLYAAYGIAGGIAALVAQCFYGAKMPRK